MYLSRPLLPIIALLVGSTFLVENQARADALKPHTTRQSQQDLEVTTLLPSGEVSKPVYFTYEQLCSLPQVNVKGAEDSTTHHVPTYTGVYVKDLLKALGGGGALDALSLACYDHYSQYFDQAYLAHHEPLLLLKYDGKAPTDWPKSEHDTPEGPYSVVYGSFTPAESFYGYTEQPRIPYGVVSAQLSHFAQAVRPLQPLQQVEDAEVQKGYRIALNGCVSCHGLNGAGGMLSGIPASTLTVLARNTPELFRDYIVDPTKFNPNSMMPKHPTYDAATIAALRAYFRSLEPAAKK